MLGETMKCPEDYLAYSKRILKEKGIDSRYPKIKGYYDGLCEQFTKIFYDYDQSYFLQWGKLLGIDAQIQILLEIAGFAQTDFMHDFGMTEEEIIEMIRHDKGCFYRELTGGNIHQEPKWGLIYLGEE
ncbi:hypothetical protein G8C15_17240 [Enterococcus casseliflavus]|nr:hypothetical protein [Enterococcus casseliflavus]MBF0015406.1 hypothetical protein [Enterococcus casseliflavus]